MASSILNFLAQRMSVSHQAADAITNHRTNDETPNFQPQTLSFQRALAAASQNGTPVFAATGFTSHATQIRALAEGQAL
ncbi:MAG: hypothetical protein ACP5QO_13495 [Clostridia bacterium]